MFNTSTLISLGLTALLCGIIMFYCKRKFVEYEQKLDVMSDLISNIITQLNQIPPSVYDNTDLANEQEQSNIVMTMNSVAMGNMPMGHMPMDNTEAYEESDTDDDEEGEVDADDKRIIVNLPNNFVEPVTEDKVVEEELDDDSWDSQEEDDEDESHKITIQPQMIDMVIDSVSLDKNEEDEPKVEVEEPKVEVEEPKVENEQPVVAINDNSETKVIDTSAPVDVDYNKMQVSMLKKMVAERNLAQGVSKMKKQELVNVLMNKPSP